MSISTQSDPERGWDQSRPRSVLAVMTGNFHPEGRELRVAPEVAAAIPAPFLAQLEALVDDPDNRCPACGQPIAGKLAELAVFTEPALTVLRLTHPDCLRSGIYSAPGSARGYAQGFADGYLQTTMTTLLALRPQRPRALLFLEPATLVGTPDQDPLEPFALSLGLSPVSAELQRLAPPRTDALTLARRPGGLALRGSLGEDFVSARGLEGRRWFRAAAGEAIVIVARGLALGSDRPQLEEALRLRPAWAAIARLEVQPSALARRRSAAQRAARRLLAAAS